MMLMMMSILMTTGDCRSRRADSGRRRDPSMTAGGSTVFGRRPSREGSSRDDHDHGENYGIPVLLDLLRDWYCMEW